MFVTHPHLFDDKCATVQPQPSPLQQASAYTEGHSVDTCPFLEKRVIYSLW